jgi:DNA (cytosine-5)-methyltransferase 1
MWREMARIVGEVRPRLVFVENSPMLVGRGAAVVISDLAKMGYDCQWCIVSASDCGAPHQRDRFWLVGHTNDYGQATAEVSAGATQRSNCSEAWQEQASELEGSGQQYEAVADTSQLQRNGGNDNAGELMGSEQVPESGNDCRSEHVADTKCKRLPARRDNTGEPKVS